MMCKEALKNMEMATPASEMVLGAGTPKHKARVLKTEAQSVSACHCFTASESCKMELSF